MKELHPLRAHMSKRFTNIELFFSIRCTERYLSMILVSMNGS